MQQWPPFVERVVLQNKPLVQLLVSEVAGLGAAGHGDALDLFVVLPTLFGGLHIHVHLHYVCVGAGMVVVVFGFDPALDVGWRAGHEHNDVGKAGLRNTMDNFVA